MKLLQLSVHNLASVADAEIDFENGPLAGEPLFLITGPTGAGKSTLLDAITLALYGTTPRKKASRQEQFEVDDERVAIGDVKQLLRRGAKEGFARLRYEGNDGRFYTATWSVARANKRLDKHIKSPVRLLLNEADDTTLNKVADIRDAVLRTVGMDFDQFCRTTLLAQGEFAKFLNSDKKDKAAILEKLTGTAYFGNLGKAIYDISVEKKAAYTEARRDLEGIELLTDQQRAELDERIDATKKECDRLYHDLTALEGRLKWLDDDALLRKRLAEQEQALQNALQTLQAPDALQRQHTVEQYRQTAEPRGWLTTLNDLAAQRRLTAAQADEHAAHARRLADAIATLQLTADTKRRQLDRVRQLLDNEKPCKAMWQEFVPINSALHSLLHALRLQEKQKQTLQKLRLATSNLAADLQQAEEAQQVAEAKEKELTDSLEQLSGTLKTIDIKGLQQRQSVLLDRQRHLGEARTALNALTSARHEQDESQRLADSLAQDISRLKQQAGQAQQAESEARVAWETARTACELMEQSVADHTRELRHTLQHGKPCPVCGTVVDTVPHDEHFVSLLAPLRRQQADAESHLQQCSVKCVEIKTQLTNTTLQRNVALDRAKQQGEQVQVHTDALRQHLVGTGLSADATQLPDNDTLAAYQKQISDNLDVMAQQLAEAGRLNDRQTELQQQQRSASATLRAAMRFTTEKRLALQENANSIKAETDNLNASREQAEDLSAQLTPLMAIADWQQRLSAEGDAFLADLERRAGNYRQAQTDNASLEDELRHHAADLDSAGRSLNALTAALPAADTLAGYRPATDAPLADIVGDAAHWSTDAAHWQQELRHLDNNSAVLSTRLRDYLARTAMPREQLEALTALTADDIAALEQHLITLQSAAERARGSVDGLREQLRQHGDFRPELADDDTPEQLSLRISSLKEQQSQTLKSLGAMNQQLDDDRHRQRTYASQQQRLLALQAESDRWETFAGEFGGNDGNRFRAIAQSLILGHLLDRANEILLRFNDHYQLRCQPGSESLTILVEDRYMALSPAGATHLSGGECFMASLALALALASLGDNGLGADTLFIDEGFGSLDENSRNQVMEALSRLHQMGGRRVGIISHVAGLEERIRPQVRVTPTAPGTSQVTVLLADT